MEQVQSGKSHFIALMGIIAPSAIFSISLPFLLAFRTFVRQAESLPVLARRVVEPILTTQKMLGRLSLFYFHVHVLTQVNTKVKFKLTHGLSHILKGLGLQINICLKGQ
jgi:hypothetical protein